MEDDEEVGDVDEEDDEEADEDDDDEDDDDAVGAKAADAEATGDTAEDDANGGDIDDNCGEATVEPGPSGASESTLPPPPEAITSLRFRSHKLKRELGGKV